MKTKRGQAAGAAVLLAIIMGLIILFLLLAPPEERSRLLGEKPSKVTSPSEKGGEITSKKIVKEVLLKETPGRLSYLKESEIEKIIPSLHIFTKTEPSILEEREYLNLKSSAFSSKTEQVPFSLTDLAHTENVLLNFNIESSQGSLIILLNEKEIFNRETNKLTPIKIPKSLLTENNLLSFQVSSPGLAFWKTNIYELKNLKIVADLADVSAQKSKNLFYVNPDENRNIEEATLRFSLSCLPEKMGPFEVKLNDYLIFSGVPENCDDIFHYTLPPEIIETGNNWLTFKTEEGDYQISHISVKIELETPSYPTYYFELKEEHFIQAKEKAACGEADGSCPSGCGEDSDPDCCFQEYSTPFWCDAKTKNSDDRCVGSLAPEDCARCPSGYEDNTNNPAETCQELCGDDTDNFCPSGCSPNYDQDCCFEQPGRQFWCSDLPTNGLDFTCLDSLRSDECSLCSSGYEGEDTSPNCPEEKGEEGEKELKKDYDLILTLSFADENKKEADLYLNGHKLSFDTYKVEFSRNIEEYAKPWTNTIKIIPQASFEVSELTVELKG